ncbi:hypothetical protein [Lentzea sp. NPDC051838]|uniref:hypothetical protein n=1 Tax=Lentzea sp. NPDC051838 TaxID=3154849 RepID=UPI00343A1EBD
MNIDQQLASLLGALDDVVDLERGLADATLPRAHAALVAGLDDALDLNTGLAQVVSPATGRPTEVLDGFVSFAAEVCGLPAAERLAARAWLSVDLLVEAYVLAEHVPTVLRLAVDLGKAKMYVQTTVRMDARRVFKDLDRLDHRPIDLHHVARALVRRLERGTAETVRQAHKNALQLRELFGMRLATLLREIDRRARGAALGHRIHGGLVNAAFAEALLEPLSRLITAVTSVAGADLTAADLAGLPLDGVRWSSDTRWPPAWEVWVRDNSVAVSADLFEIRGGETGSRLPT